MPIAFGTRQLATKTPQRLARLRVLVSLGPLSFLRRLSYASEVSRSAQPVAGRQSARRAQHRQRAEVARKTACFWRFAANP